MNHIMPEPNFSCHSSITFGFRMQHETNRKLLTLQAHLPKYLHSCSNTRPVCFQARLDAGHWWDNPDTQSLHQKLTQTSLFKTCVYRGHVWIFKNSTIKLLLLYARVIKKINLILHKNCGNVSNFGHNFFLPRRDCFEGLSVSCRKHKNTSLGS